MHNNLKSNRAAPSALGNPQGERASDSGKSPPRFPDKIVQCNSQNAEGLKTCAEPKPNILSWGINTLRNIISG